MNDYTLQPLDNWKPKYLYARTIYCKVTPIDNNNGGWFVENAS